jgi:hypothetical protein
MEQWDQSQCEERYIQGAEISLEALHRLSGVPFSTLRRWSSKGQWVRKRGDYQSRLSQETREKTIQKTSDRLSDELSELAIEHLNAYKLCRKIATIKGAWMLEQLEQSLSPLQPHPEVSESESSELAEKQAESAIAKLDIMSLNVLNLVIDRSVRGERLSTGMDFENINKAISTIEQAGLKVSVKDNETLAELVVGQTRQEYPSLVGAS